MAVTNMHDGAPPCHHERTGAVALRGALNVFGCCPAASTGSATVPPRVGTMRGFCSSPVCECTCTAVALAGAFTLK